MRRWTRILALAFVLATSAVVTWAYWSQAGSGSASATTASLDAASISVPGAAINSVTVTWTAQSSLNPSSAANSAITYTVERKLGAGSWAAIASGGCSGSKARGTTSCIDTPASAGSYTYRAVAAYHSWTATSNAAGAVTVTIDTTPPTVSSIVVSDANPTNATSAHWTVTFSESVTGVGSTDFALATTGSVSGATISSVTGSGAAYIVTVATSTGIGSLGLNLVDDDTIIDTAANKLGGTGTGNGNLTGQTYTLDLTPPSVSTIARAGSSPTNASSLQWTVTFSESVTGVGAGDFAPASTGISGASVSSVTGSGAAYTVTVTTGTGDGTLGLNLVDDDTIIDTLTNKLGGTGAGNGNLTGDTYTIDKTAPAVSSIVRVGSSPSNAGSLQWTVTFGESVTGVGTSDFSLVATGSITGATISSVTGSGTTYTVAVATGSGVGTLGLNLVDDDTIIDGAGNKVGGAGANNGDLTGPTYTLDLTPPTVASILLVNSSPTNAASVQWTVTFSESVTGVGTNDFALAGIGVSGASITAITGSGTTYTLTVLTGSGDGTLGLNLVDDDTIIDTLTNKLGGTGAGNGTFTGATYTLDLTPPTVTSILRVAPTLTNATSVQWTATFSESVTGVGMGDFAPVGTGVTGASITGIAGSGTTYTLTATTGGGDGTLGLNLVDDDTIIDALANKLGGPGVANGNFPGQTYTIDKTPPNPATTVSVTNGASPSSFICSIAATTRFINNAGKATVIVNATFPAASVSGDAMLFSISTPGSTPVTATVSASPPSTSVSTTLDLSSAAFLDGPVTLTAQTRDPAGNLSSTLTGMTTLVTKDTVAILGTPVYHALGGGGGLGLGSHITGSAECGATVVATRSTGGSYQMQALGATYDLDPVGLLLVIDYYNVTSTDLVGNTHAAIRVP